MSGEQGFELQAAQGERCVRVDVDLGDDHTLQFTIWYGDPAEQVGGAIVTHRRSDGSWCQGSITFDVPISREKRPVGPRWIVESWEPLTLSPSLRCHCGDHGFIREGQWVQA